jgi:hypothetical protein
MTKHNAPSYEQTIYAAQALEDAAARRAGEKPRLISTMADVERFAGSRKPPRCPEEFCKADARPYCHCQSCGETDRFLTEDGYCAECLAAEQNVCPVCRQTDCCRCAEKAGSFDTFRSGELRAYRRERGTLYKLSEVVPTPDGMVGAFTAELVYPKPGHTTVHTFVASAWPDDFPAPSAKLVRSYERAWGLLPERK